MMPATPAPSATLSSPERFASAAVRLEQARSALGVEGMSVAVPFEEACRRLEVVRHELGALRTRHDD